MQLEAPKVKEFSSGAELIADYRAVRERLRPRPLPVPRLVAAAPEPVPVEPPAPPRAPIVHMSGNIFAPLSNRTERPVVLVACPYTGTVTEKQIDPPRCKDIIEETARHYRVSVIDLLSHRRMANVIRPRQIAMYLCCTITMRSLPFVSTMFDDRDHTTILYAKNKIARLVMDRDPAVVSAIAAITNELRHRFTF